MKIKEILEKLRQIDYRRVDERNRETLIKEDIDQASKEIIETILKEVEKLRKTEHDRLCAKITCTVAPCECGMFRYNEALDQVKSILTKMGE